MDKIKDQLELFSRKYEPYFIFIFSNMRLVLLIVFSILCGGLVARINMLINSAEPSVDSSKNSTSQTPDKDVVSVFKELQAKPVSLDSEFQSSRSNPF